MNEFSPVQPQAARQFSSSCAESHPATLKSWGLPDGTPTRDAETSEAQREESGLSIEPKSPAESRQSTMSTEATDRLAIGEIGADAPAGQHTYELAGSHDCELVVAPTGQGITASLEARAGRTLIPAESNLVQNMTTDSNPALTPSEEEVQKPASAPSVQPQSYNGCTPEVASGSPVSTLSNTSENKPEGVNLPAAAEGEPSAEAEFGSSAATNSNQSKAMKANQIEKVSSGQAEEDAQVNTCEQTVQPAVEINACAASPGETEQIASPQAEPPSAVYSDSTNSDAAARASANLNSGTDFVATTNTNTVMNTTSNTTATVQTDDASAVTPVSLNNANITSDNSTMSPDIQPELWEVIFNDTLVDQTPGTLGNISFEDNLFTIEEGGAYLEVNLTADDIGTLKIQKVGDTTSIDTWNITAQLEVGEWIHLNDVNYWLTTDFKYLPAGNYRISHQLYNDPNYGSSYNRALYRFKIRKLSLVKSNIPLPKGKARICCNCMGCIDKEGNELEIAIERLPITLKYDCMSAYEFKKNKKGTIKNRTQNVTNPCGYLKSISPFAWTASVDPDNGDIYLTTPKDQVLRFCRDTNTNELYPVGATASAGFQLEQSDEATLILHDDVGQKLTFSISTGKVTSFTDANGCITTAEEVANQAIVEHDDDGNVKSVYSAINGYASIVTETDGSVLVSWFAPEQVTLQEDSTVTTVGEPYNTVQYRVQENELGTTTVTMTRQQKDMTPHIITRTEEPGRVTITNGSGDEAIVRVFEQNINTDGLLIKTETLKKGENIASATTSVFCYSPAGWLLVKKTEAYGTLEAQNTYYHYNAQHRVQSMTNDAGAYTEYEYDYLGRITMEKSPWGASLAKVTRTSYATVRFFDIRAASVAEYYVNDSGAEVLFRNTAHAYEDSAELERVTTTVTAGGSSQQQVSIDERYGSAPAYAYAAGKPKFSQNIVGVQTWHEYEGTTEHEAIHKHTTITKVNGELVAAQSRKIENFIAADDTITFGRASIWDGENWLLLDTTAYEYDEQQRVTKATRGNGRFSTTTWMCCGRLSETDEDGITTSYAYDSARKLKETSRAEVYDGETCITPETITEYTQDAAGRILSISRRIGAKETIKFIEYDFLGRVIKQTDELGRMTSTTYSPDGRTTTTTYPSGAVSIHTYNTDGTIAAVSGSAQRPLQYVYDINGNSLRTTKKLEDGSIIEQVIINGFGQTTVQAKASTDGFIYTRSEYDSKGRIVKQYQDTGWNTAKTAATLYEYDDFGNISKQILALADTPSKDNSPIVEMTYGVESLEDGVFSVITQTRYNAAGEPLSTTQKQLISQLSATLASKSISTDIRGNSIVNWSIFTAPARITSYSTIPTSSITSESVAIDSFTISHKDYAGIVTTSSRAYTASGMTMVNVDGRGNATTVHSDLAGRTISVTDANGAVTSTIYDTVFNRPAVVTDAIGNTSCYKYDHRGRKIAEWGTGIQPVCFGYDDNNNILFQRTFRAGTETICSDPSERTDGDVTTWNFHPATGLELSKTYADGSTVVKTYDAYNRIATETDARGNVKTHSYEHARGLHLETSYTVVEGTEATATQSFSYNHLGQLTTVVDDAGTRSYGYNSYGERESDSLVVDGDAHLITETRDSFGRSTGYTYAKNDMVQQTVTTGYGDDGRIASAGFLHGGEAKNFGYTYLAGTNLLQTLTMPNGMTLTQTYEATRDLLTGMAYHRGSTLVAQREYTYDVLGRPNARNTARQGSVVNDTFTHNSRAELIEAQVNGKAYEYTYDNIGNRTAAVEDSTGEGSRSEYTANALNQYTSISENGATTFAPQFDQDGNQTLVKTETGIWATVFNAENRPVSFTNEESNTVVECAYDSMGRRAYKKVTVNGEVTLYQRYLYRDYLQIACLDLTRTTHPALWFITWNSAHPVTSRPLAIQKDGTWYTYGIDISKNICELFGNSGYIVATYTYTPFGAVTSSGNVSQPIQWSSEFYENETRLIYYNYRYYNTLYSNWNSKDKLENMLFVTNHYLYNKNSSYKIDYLGLWSIFGLGDSEPKKIDYTINGGLKIHYNKDLCCYQCNQFLKKSSKTIRSVFTAEELDEEHCTYNLYCESQTQIATEHTEWRAERIGGYETGKKYIGENFFRNKSAEMKVAVKCNTANKMDVLIHEMQHAVDDCHNKNIERRSKSIDDRFMVRDKEVDEKWTEKKADLVQRMRIEIPAYSRADVMRDGKSDKKYHDVLFDRVMGSVLADVEEHRKAELRLILRGIYDNMPDKAINRNYKSKK